MSPHQFIIASGTQLFVFCEFGHFFVCLANALKWIIGPFCGIFITGL
jgi:hypothetical protein